MTERERLIKLIEDGTRIAYDKSLEEVRRIVKENHHFNSATDRTVSISEIVADYLLSNGVIVPPVNVGDTVFIKGEALNISFMRIEEEIYYGIQFDCEECCVCPFYEDEVSWEGEHDCGTNGYLEFTANDIGKTVFLTREEAEKALEESEDNA